MTAPRPVRRRISPANEAPKSSPAEPPTAPQPNDRTRPARRDNPDTPPSKSPLPNHWRVHQPRSYTTSEIPERRRRARKNESPSSAQPSFEELDRWDEEWRGEWDRGDIDDSAAYEEELDVAEQTRDVEWLLDALDALDDTGSDDDDFDWEE